MGKVAICKCGGYEAYVVKESVDRLFDLLGGVERFVYPGMKVLLKPNLVMAKKAEDGATTHPALVEAVAQKVKSAGGKAVIADSPGGPYIRQNLKAVYRATGMKQVAENTGCLLNYDLDICTVEGTESKFLKRINIMKPVADADLVINLPKLKTHGMMVYTGAVKNMFGVIPGVAKADYHFRMPDYNNFADAIIDIYLSAGPRLTIMDAVIGMEGDGPTGGDLRNMGFIMGSENAFNLDACALHIIDTDLETVPVMGQALKRGLLSDRFSDIDIDGDSIEKFVVKDFNIKGTGDLKNINLLSKGPLKIFMPLFKSKPVFSPELCIGCGECAKNCPASIIKIKDKKPKADLSKCIRCYCCQELCPKKAVVIKRSRIAGFLFKSQKKR